MQKKLALYAFFIKKRDHFLCTYEPSLHWKGKDCYFSKNQVNLDFVCLPISIVVWKKKFLRHFIARD